MTEKKRREILKSLPFRLTLDRRDPTHNMIYMTIYRAKENDREQVAKKIAKKFGLL